jgi:undecaprenyl diphosphate synthase
LRYRKADTDKVKFEHFPRHIAIIMDGNRRWAEKRGLPVAEGHRAGVKSLRTVVNHLGNYGLPYLTVYGFSTENWRRSTDEVKTLLSLLEEVLVTDTGELHKNEVRLQHLGRLTELSPNLQEAIKEAAVLTKDNKGMVFSVAFNYGGRDELTGAVRRIIGDGITADKINENLIGNYLYTAGMPDVDLVIRTGGENRLSNFLTWQTVYSEMYFTDVLWPDFNSAEIDKALMFYSRKQRRFGG